MKPALSLMLTLSLASPDSIGRAITREAARLAAEPTAIDAGRQTNAPDSDWSRVMKLDSGLEIIVTQAGAQTVTRKLLYADGSGIILLNVSDRSVPRDVLAMIRNIAETTPGLLKDAPLNGVDFQAKRLRLNREGVFLADQKVAELSQVIETINRPQVAEVKLTPDEHHIARAAGIGMLIGGLVGAVWGQANDCTGCDVPGLAPVAGAMTGIAFGAGIGIGAGAAKNHTDHGRIVYRAP